VGKCHPEILEKYGITDDVSLLNFLLKNRSDWGGVYGKDFDDIKHEVLNYPPFEYKKYEKGLARPDGKPGFMTATGRFEFSILPFEQWGIESVPYWEEPPESPYSTPELCEKYPLVLTTGARMWGYFHSEHRQFPNMREIQPDPQIRMNPKTAEKYGIKEGDWVWIENMRGRCRQKAVFDPSFDERVVAADHGWWFPEQEAAEPHLFGVFDSNINNLTSQMQYGSTGYGAPYKCTICKIYPCTEENSKVMPGEQVTRKGGWKYEEAQPIDYNLQNTDIGGREISNSAYAHDNLK
jgi:anaerobic selenocysteine-containing dehydrogenase